METILLHGSPLAAYIEGDGEADGDEHQRCSTWERESPTIQWFAPRGRPDFITAFRRRHTSVVPRQPPFSSLRRIGVVALNSTLGRADNERFLEHFRYTIIASQLLQEHTAPGILHSNSLVNPGQGNVQNGQPPFTLTGVTLSTFVAFAVVWATKEAYNAIDPEITWSTALLITITIGILGVVSYAYMRRHLLLYLRRQAIDTASDFVINAQSFGSASSSMIALIQEVELVSRGYRISTPLPPVSRLEGEGSNRKCKRLRKSLQVGFCSVIPSFARACQSIRSLIEEDDLDRYLDVYDVRSDDVRDSMRGFVDLVAEESEGETLTVLRALQHRYNTLRRLLLCSLLSLPATGRKIDVARWRSANNEMDNLNIVVSRMVQNLQNLMNEEERFVEITPSSEPMTPASPNRDRLHSQIRRISTLSTGIKSLQAKMHLLREDSARALSKSTSESETAAISVSLRDQYDALGNDIKSLMQAWETGKAALAVDITRHERRVSRTLSGLSSFDPGQLSPALSPGGLMAVNENGLRLSRRGSPNSALRALNGESPLPLSPPATENGSVSAEEDEFFEAVAIPRQRSIVSRDQRIAKMREDREKQLVVREQKDASSSMMQELESVIKLRPARRSTTGRVTSL